MMIVIYLFLVASVVIGAVQLATTPTEIIGANFEGLPRQEFPR